jgi:peptide/nickel transport system permease protein
MTTADASEAGITDVDERVPSADARQRRHIVLVVTGFVCLAVVFVALAGPLLTSTDPTRTVGRPFSSDSGWLGTDAIGRDVWSRLLHGGRGIVLVAMTATLAATILGTLLGVAVGLARPRVAAIVTWCTDLLIVFPAVLLLLLLATGFPGSDLAVVLAVTLTTLPYSVRVVGTATRRVAGNGYVEVARARGDGLGQVVRFDVLPNVAGPVLADAGLRFVAAIYLASLAGFLGLGAGAPVANWGRMISENVPGASANVAAFLAPLVLVLALSVAVNMLADELAGRVARP